MTGSWPVTRAELAEAACLFDVDEVPGQPEVTDFKRRARWQQKCWREQRGFPSGFHVSGDPPQARPNGTRFDADKATTSGYNFLSAAILASVRERVETAQEHQTLDERRLWSDLLSSMPMCFNLFGETRADRGRLSAASHALASDHPGTPTAISFEWSPGRRDPTYLGNRTAFDAAIELDLGQDARGIIGVETKYHEHIKAEKAPDPKKRRLERYMEVAGKANVLRKGWELEVIGKDLQQLWLDHLLALAMLQHPSGKWRWARFIVVYPAANPSVSDAVRRYRDLLTDGSTFDGKTIEELLDAHIQTPETERLFRERYLW